MKTLLILSIAFFSRVALAEVPTLSIQAEGFSRTFKETDLMKSKDRIQLKLDEDSHYQKKHATYSAVPITVLFKGASIPTNAMIQFTATDGFSGIIRADRLLDKTPGHSHAFLAFHLPESEKSFGPFYLVWENPKASHVSTEEWPYALASLAVKSEKEVSFPKLQPEPQVPSDDPIRRGQAVFLKNCFTCHTLNREGNSHVGPDLNVPYNPLEYFKDGFFEKYVRNIQDIHYFPQAKMNAFPKETISDEELKDLHAYLEHMSKRKLP